MERGGAGWSGTSKPSHESSTTVLSTLELDRTDLSIVRDRGAAGGSDSEQKVAMIQRVERGWSGVERHFQTLARVIDNSPEHFGARQNSSEHREGPWGSGRQ